jgi:hypothetical protein
MLHESTEIKRIKASLNKARIQRNAKTAVILLVASSGALISQSALAITAAGTFATLILTTKIKTWQSSRKNDDS